MSWIDCFHVGLVGLVLDLFVLVECLLMFWYLICWVYLYVLIDLVG